MRNEQEPPVPTVRIDVCGTLRITVAGDHREDAIRPQAHVVLAVLALNRGRQVSRADLVDTLWGADAAPRRPEP